MPAAPGQAEDSLRPFPGRPGAVANQGARVDAACPTIPGMAAMPVPCSSTVEPVNRTAKCAAAKATSDGLRYCQCCPVRSREMRALFLRALANRPEREFGFVRISNALGRSYQLAAQPSALLVLVPVAPGGLLVRLQLVPITRSREAVYVQPCGDLPALRWSNPSILSCNRRCAFSTPQTVRLGRPRAIFINSAVARIRHALGGVW